MNRKSHKYLCCEICANGVWSMKGAGNRPVHCTAYKFAVKAINEVCLNMTNMRFDG